MARFTLESTGHRVVEAGSGEEALDLIERERPDLVLLDIGLPGIDGWEVLDRLRADDGHRELPVVMVSAYSEPESIERARAAGSSGYVTKPFSPKALLDLVDELLAE